MTTWQARDRKINRASAQRGVSSLGTAKCGGGRERYGPASLKGSVKSDEAFSFTGVWIAYGASANVRTGREMRLAYTLRRLMYILHCSVGHSN